MQVLAINGAALPSEITINFAAVTKPDVDAGIDGATEMMATDVWTGRSLGKRKSDTQQVQPHGNVFLILDPGSPIEI